MSSKELFRFVDALTVTTFTSSNEAETYNGEVYAPRVMGRSEINDKAQVTKATVDVSFPIKDEFAQHLLNNSSDTVIRLDIYSKDEDGTINTEWRGRLQKVAPDNGKQIKATFLSVFSENRRVGARPVFQRPCRHTVYGPGCGLNIDDFKIAATVTAMSADGTTLTIPEAADGRPYRAGVIIFSDGTTRYFTAANGTTLTMVRSSDTLNAQFAAAHPVAVEIAPGCDQTEATCIAVFNNLPNYGGFRRIPLNNPMGGNSIV